MIDECSILVTIVGIVLLSLAIFYQSFFDIIGLTHYGAMLFSLIVISIGTLMHIYVHIRS